MICFSRRQSGANGLLRKSSGAIATAAAILVALTLGPAPASASSLFFFSTGDVDGKIATASRPGPLSGPNQETESADDFILSNSTRINAASFTGLLPAGVSLSSISHVVVEIYSVFPNDSDVGRTSGAPTFSTPQVPTRVNSPSDVAFRSADSAMAGELSFSATLLGGGFAASNSVDLGINPFPNQTTGGAGPVVGQEVQVSVTLNAPFDLAAGHYFFVPQVELTDPDAHFLWLSASKPIVAPGTPFVPDLQSWIRNAHLDPDWLRIGTDIVGGTAFNAAFELSGTVSTVPLPGTLDLLGMGLFGFGLLHRAARASGRASGTAG